MPGWIPVFGYMENDWMYNLSYLFKNVNQQMKTETTIAPGISNMSAMQQVNKASLIGVRVDSVYIHAPVVQEIIDDIKNSQ